MSEEEVFNEERPARDDYPERPEREDEMSNEIITAEVVPTLKPKRPELRLWMNPRANGLGRFQTTDASPEQTAGPDGWLPLRIPAEGEEPTAHMETDVVRLHNELAALRAELAKRNEQIRGRDVEVRAMREKFHNAARERNGLSIELTETRAQLAALRARLAEVEREKVELTCRIEQVEASRDHYRARIAEVERERDEHAENAHDLAVSVNELQGWLADAKRSNAAFVAAADAMRVEAQELRRMLLQVTLEVEVPQPLFSQTNDQCNAYDRKLTAYDAARAALPAGPEVTR